MATTPKIRRSYKGAPIAAALDTSGVSSATQTAISLTTSPTSWPTGKFFIVVAPGTAQEEKMCVTLSGSTLTVCDPFVSSTSASANGRGVDNTTARTTIAGGATVYPVATAVDFDEANSLTSTYAAQGDVVYLGDPSFTKLALGTTGQVLKANASTKAPEWGEVTATGLATDAVETLKIKDLNVTAAKLASDAVEEAKIKDQAVTSAKIKDLTIVDGDISATAAIADTKLDTISTANKVSIAALDIDGGTDIGAALVDGDLIVVDDGAGGTNRKSAMSRVATYLFGKVSGDITTTSAGVASIGSGKVTSTHILDGTIANADISDTAGIAVSKLESVAWTSWTPAWTASSSNPSNYTGTGLYRKINRMVVAKGKFAATGTPGGSGTYYISLPVTAASTGWALGEVIGTWSFYDSSAGTSYSGVVMYRTTTTAFVGYNGIEEVSVGIWVTRQYDWATTKRPVEPATGDEVKFIFTYEAAS